MYVRRNKKGKVLEYNQWLGDPKRFSATSRKLTPFKPNKIAHLMINHISGQPYGLGYIYPNMKQIDFLMGNETDLHKLMVMRLICIN